MTTPNFLTELLGETPELEFFSRSGHLDRSPNQRRFFRNSFNDVLNIYRGELGRIARQGRLPTQSFGNFLDNFDFPGFFQSQTPAQRGFFPSNINAPNRFLF